MCSGGLLADVRFWLASLICRAYYAFRLLILNLFQEMGLGKTLTVLALIAGSLDCRENKLENNQLLIRENERNCSMTTLIITPKSSEFQVHQRYIYNTVH